MSGLLSMVRLCNAHHYGLTILLILEVLCVCISEKNVPKLHSNPLHQEPGPVIMLPLSDNKDCGQGAGECLKKLQTFLHLRSLPFASDVAEIDKLCNASVEGYNCSEKLALTPHCLTLEEQLVIKSFAEMGQYLYLMFCPSGPKMEGYFRPAMLEHGGCISEQKKALDCCAEHSKVPDLPVMQIWDESGKSVMEKKLTVCCPMTNFLECTSTVVESSCGQSAENFTMTYVRRSAGAAVQELCQDLHNYPKPDPEFCTDPVPECSGSRSIAFVPLISILCLLFVLWTAN